MLAEQPHSGNKTVWERNELRNVGGVEKVQSVGSEMHEVGSAHLKSAGGSTKQRDWP